MLFFVYEFVVDIFIYSLGFITVQVELIFVVEIGSVRIDLLVVLRFMDELINLC
jgi:hypothetical protein